GTLTPRPQPGNPKPRLFRLKPAEAIINRMGFNNPGIDEAVQRLNQRVYPGVLGVNIGKNFDTPNEAAAEDYLKGLRAAYQTADYIAINLSSPNTKALRELQLVSQCRPLLKALIAERDRLADTHGNRVPLAIKIAPDLEDSHVKELADLFSDLQLDAVIATNTTIDRSRVSKLTHAEETGGLSGGPVRERATEVITILKNHLSNAMPIIGVGGISSSCDALEKLQAGASLVQIYTGFVYHGSRLIDDILTTLDQSTSIDEV
ncbi:MAG: dihydroorotate dehydrogenase (quinone), partial [Verrucomicrobiales bacterium]